MKFSFASVTEYLNSRTPREKIMLIGAGIFTVFALDVALIVMPVGGYVVSTWPELSTVTQQRADMRRDRDRKDQILEEWQKARQALDEKEQMFIAPNQSESVLKSLSKLAQSSHIKVLSLTPFEAAPPTEKLPYRIYPIKISALGGAHELGRFIAQLESSPTFFRVKDMVIRGGAETPKHQIELWIEMYEKAGVLK